MQQPSRHIRIVLPPRAKELDLPKRPAPAPIITAPPVEWLNLDEAVARSRQSESTLSRAIASGALVGTKVGRRLVIKSTDLEAWLDTHRVAGEQAA